MGFVWKMFFIQHINYNLKQNDKFRSQSLQFSHSFYLLKTIRSLGLTSNSIIPIPICNWTSQNIMLLVLDVMPRDQNLSGDDYNTLCPIQSPSCLRPLNTVRFLPVCCYRSSGTMQTLEQYSWKTTKTITQQRRTYRRIILFLNAEKGQHL